MNLRGHALYVFFYIASYSYRYTRGQTKCFWFSCLHGHFAKSLANHLALSMLANSHTCNFMTIKNEKENM